MPMYTTYSHRRRIKLNELISKPLSDLVAIAEAQKIVIQSNLSRWELVVQILRSAYNSGAQLTCEGILEIQKDGFGLLRDASVNTIVPSSVYISPTQIKDHQLLNGANVLASIRPPLQEEYYFSVKSVM